MEKILEIMKEINDIPLVSSREDLFIFEVEKKLKFWLPRYKIKNVDNNLLAYTDIKKIDNLLVAHIDEIGFVAKKQLNDNTYKLDIIGLVDKTASHGIKVQTFVKNKKHVGVIGNTLPHSGEKSEELIAEFSEPVNLPPLWSIQFVNEPVFGDYILSKTMDNHLGVASIINTAIKKDMPFVLTVGEEEGTQRLTELMKEIPRNFSYNNIFVIDSALSNQDYYYKEKTMMNEGNLGVIPVEGGGGGNVAPEKLIGKVKKMAEEAKIGLNTIETRHPDEITDATNLYKIGFESISICYPLRYIHNPVEVANRETIEKLNEFLIKI